MIAAMSSAEGPLGPGLRRCVEEEKSRRYFRSTKALWNLSSVAGLMSAPSFGIRCGRTNNVAKPRTTRSTEVRLGARCRERLLMSNWCLSSKDSAATARTPPGRSGFANVTSRWMARMSRFRTWRTVTLPPSHARLHRTRGFAHTRNSPPTGSRPRRSAWAAVPRWRAAARPPAVDGQRRAA